MNSHHGEKRLHYRLSVLVFPLLLLAMLAACGGGGALSGNAGASLDNSNSGNQLSSSPAGQLLPLGSPLPALPEDTAGAGDVQRASSAVQDYPGAEFLVAAGASVQDSSLLLQSSSADKAWALYRATGLHGLSAAGLTLTSQSPQPGTTYYLGVGSFTDNRWHWQAQSSLPELSVALDDSQQWISELGNLYWVVLVDGGDSLSIDRTSISAGFDNPGTGEPISITGQIDAINETGIVVGNIGFDHGISTLWLSLDSKKLARSAFMPGMLVRVDGTKPFHIMGGDTANFARVVTLLEDNGGPTGFSVDGSVSAVDATNIVVTEAGKPGSQVIMHDQNTVFSISDGSPASWTDLHAGSKMHAEGQIMPGGAWLAGMVVITKEAGSTVEFSGLIDSINSGGMVVGNLSLQHDGLTAWFGENGEPLIWANFHPGDTVQGEAQSLANGLLASVVNLIASGGSAEPVEFSGKVDSIGAGSIVVDNAFFFHGSETQWFDENGQTVFWATIQPGDTVQGSALPTQNGFLCTVVTRTALGSQNFSETGSISELNSASFMLESINSGPQLVLHDADTHFFLPDGTSCSWDALSDGDTVIVGGEIESDGSWRSRLVFKNGGGESVSGQLFNSSESTLQVFQTNTCTIIDLTHDSSTVWIMPDGSLGDWSMVPVGSQLVVEYETLGDGSKHAIAVLVMSLP